MRIFRLAIAGLLLAVASGCTAVRVQPISADHTVDHICIQHNPKVQVSDFVSVMQEGFTKYGITSQVINGNASRGCGYTATYTARRTWDITTYLSQAQIDVQRDGRQIATAHYHLRGKGGFALNKWAGTRSKILPVMDQLLAKVKTDGQGKTLVSAAPTAMPEPAEAAPVRVVNADAPANSELAVKLAHLKDAYDAQLISQAEYDAKRKELIDRL